MELIINNLRPIKNNTQGIDLSKRFYAFVGYNNSGKTYVAQLLWTIYNEHIISRFSASVKLDIFNNIFETKELEITEQLINQILESFSLFLKKQLIKTYRLKNQSHGIENMSLSFRVNGNDIQRIKERLFLDDSAFLDFMIKKSENSLILKLFPSQKTDENLVKAGKQVQTAMYRDSFVSFLIFLLLQFRFTFFLPASRTFYATFYQYIYDIERRKQEESQKQLLDILENEEAETDLKSLKESLRKKIFTRPYTEPMNKVFQAIYNLNFESQPVTYYSDILNSLSEIMGGNIILGSVEGISMIDFVFQFNQQENVPMYLASSSVNQLTLLYLYFKYWVQKAHNFLIIDEPEENLHPENQTKLIDLLIQFATQNNNKVLITTHSPLITDTVNHYIYLNKLKEYDFDVAKIIEEHDLQYLNENTSIPREQVGIYFFTGDKIIDYETGYYGIYVRNFREVRDSLNKSSQVLTDYIYAKENEEEL